MKVYVLLEEYPEEVSIYGVYVDKDKASAIASEFNTSTGVYFHVEEHEVNE